VEVSVGRRLDPAIRSDVSQTLGRLLQRLYRLSISFDAEQLVYPSSYTVTYSLWSFGRMYLVAVLGKVQRTELLAALIVTRFEVNRLPFCDV
jgi:hypothetical protein